jgi:ubiquinone/menaquinone biosynthesis C-methylase UbiE
MKHNVVFASTSNRTNYHKQHWDNLASKYEQFYGLNKPETTAKLLRKAELIYWQSGIKPDDLVLELGCGTGIFTELIALQPIQIIATDISEKMIAKAQARNLKNVGFLTKDIHQLVFKQNAFDSIIGFYVLQYTEMPYMLMEIKRLLKPNSKIAFLEPNALNPILYAVTNIPLIRKLAHRPTYNKSRTKWQWYKLLKEHGFIDTEIKPIEFVANRKLNTFIENIPIIKELAGTLVISARVDK